MLIFNSFSVSDFTADIFSFRKGSFWLNIFAKRDNKKDKNINISNLKKDFRNLKHTFWARTNRSTMLQKIISKCFCQKKLDLLEISWKRNRKKPRPKLKKYVYYTFNENICSACDPMQMVAFWKRVLIL